MQKNGRIGNAQGVSLDIFDKLRDFKGNGNTYSLLMYVVDIINKSYPDCKDWIDIFNECEDGSKIKTDELKKNVVEIQKKVDNLELQLNKMKESRIEIENKKKKWKK